MSCTIVKNHNWTKQDFIRDSHQLNLSHLRSLKGGDLRWQRRDVIIMASYSFLTQGQVIVRRHVQPLCLSADRSCLSADRLLETKEEGEQSKIQNTTVSRAINMIEGK